MPLCEKGWSFRHRAGGGVVRVGLRDRPFETPVAILLLPGGIDGEGGGTWNTVKAPPRGFAPSGTSRQDPVPNWQRATVLGRFCYAAAGWKGGQSSIKFSFHPDASRHHPMPSTKPRASVSANAKVAYAIVTSSRRSVRTRSRSLLAGTKQTLLALGCLTDSPHHYPNRAAPSARTQVVRSSSDTGTNLLPLLRLSPSYPKAGWEKVFRAFVIIVTAGVWHNANYISCPTRLKRRTM